MPVNPPSTLIVHAVRFQRKEGGPAESGVSTESSEVSHKTLLDSMGFLVQEVWSIQNVYTRGCITFTEGI